MLTSVPEMMGLYITSAIEETITAIICFEYFIKLFFLEFDAFSSTL